MHTNIFKSSVQACFVNCVCFTFDCACMRPCLLVCVLACMPACVRIMFMTGSSDDGKVNLVSMISQVIKFHHITILLSLDPPHSA